MESESESGDRNAEVKRRSPSPTVGPVRSGKLVVIVFVGAAAGLIGGSWALLRWAKNKSYESLVHPPGATAAPTLPMSPTSPTSGAAPGSSVAPSSSAARPAP